MAAYVTLAELRDFGKLLSEERRISVAKAQNESSPGGSTFLSHSSKDQEFVFGAVRILEGHGATVYIDKKDDSLPSKTNRNTAKVLRTRIQQCTKFVVLATTNSKDSKWIPWELGLADGYKSESRVAIFPGVDQATNTAWAEREYLGVYDRVVWGRFKGQEKSVWMVWNQDENSATELSDWLKQ